MDEATLESLLAGDRLHSEYQPIVDLFDRDVVAYEAFLRGPADSDLANPTDLLDAARAAGMIEDLDWSARAVAASGALKAGLPEKVALFVNVEPDVIGAPLPPYLRDAVEAAASQLGIVVELTESQLATRPGELLPAIRALRDLGFGLAIDDIGTDASSLAFLPVLAPDVVKLDRQVVRGKPSLQLAEVVSAVASYSERTGAPIVAEGIETEADVEAAIAIGATHGQGWYFGRPGALPASISMPGVPIDRRPHADSGALTPATALRALLRMRHASGDLLWTISRRLEARAEACLSPPVVLSTFQHADRFATRTADVYERLARNAAFVGAFAQDLSLEPVPGVRGTTLLGSDALREEWDVVVLGAHFSGALISTQCHRHPGKECFDYALTYDRELVAVAARILLARVAPELG